MNTELTKLAAVQRALAEAQSVGDCMTGADDCETLRQIAKIQGLGLNAQNAAAEYKLRFERKGGALIAAMPKNTGNRYGGCSVQPPPTLEELGIEKTQAHRWQLESGVSDDKFERWIADTKEDAQEITSAGLLHIARNLHVSDDSYEWYTPKEYIEAARTVMGGIDLDPASTEEAQAIVGAARFYTQEDDGLQQAWQGRVWLNPPYCMPDVQDFVTKAIECYQRGDVSQAVVLTNNCTDAGWFHLILAAAGTACFTRGRVKFWGPHSAQARQGQTLFYLGPDTDNFARTFARFGSVVSTYDK